MIGMWNKLKRICKHRWLDEGDANRAVPADMVERLMRRVTASEKRHSGEIRICVEAGLPLSYLWRDARARERAITLFGKLRVWDTELNNGVLIYLLLADHAIEIVADRGLNQRVTESEWKVMVSNLGTAIREGRYEDGLTQALEEVSAVLVTHFPLMPSDANSNELPNRPIVG